MKLKLFALSLIFLLIFQNKGYLQELDIEFGEEGILFIDVLESSDQACELSLTENGDIIIAGHANLIPSQGNDLFITKYSSQGIIEESFGDEGIKLIEMLGATNQFCKDFSFNMGSSIIFADHYSSSHSDLLLIKCDENGQIDSTFANEGVKIFNFFDDHDYSIGIESISGSENLYIAYTSYAQNDDFESGILCMNSFGDLNPSFGDNGVFKIEPTNPSVLREFKSHGNNLYYVNAYNNLTPLEHHSIGCILENGQLNQQFNNGNPIEIDNLPGWNRILDFEISQDGYLYFLTGIHIPNDPRLAVRKINQNGELVESFGDSGTMIYEFTDSKNVSTAQLVPDLEDEGVLIVGGYLPLNPSINTSKIFTLKLTEEGQIDNSYGIEGRFDLDISESNIQIESVVQSSSNEILILGDEINNVGVTKNDFFISKLKVPLTTNTSSTNSFSDAIKLFPNPTKDHLIIQIDQKYKNDFKLLISNEIGQVVHQEILNRSENLVLLDLLSFENGIYYINLIGDEVSIIKTLIIAN